MCEARAMCWAVTNDNNKKENGRGMEQSSQYKDKKWLKVAKSGHEWLKMAESGLFHSAQNDLPISAN
ncbi:predicted protein [Botrytis cinerea T4]|uniref:Uncharacterized protein n=1 Tax=Botryotinia fuckeliana (strain T4) TaxID=999810 RepID=G2Y6W3_BOTF4|nr:predicted protein [Botrytis cinerea T4]